MVCALEYNIERWSWTSNMRHWARSAQNVAIERPIMSLVGLLAAARFCVPGRAERIARNGMFLG